MDNQSVITLYEVMSMTVFKTTTDSANIEITDDSWADCAFPELELRRNKFMQTAARILGELCSSGQYADNE